jgi:glycerol-3-phosphate dehydrogenase (NAD(P)+)
MKSISIIGAGSWGTALGVALAGAGRDIRLWAYEAEVVARIQERRENHIYLPGIQLPPGMAATGSLEEALDGAEIVLTVVPSHVCRAVFDDMRPHLRSEMLFVSATKGIEADPLMRMTQVIRDVVGNDFQPAVCALSGPSFAREVAAGHPTAVVAAADSHDLAAQVQAEFSSANLRVYTSTDLVGVELGGALKNVIAIAAGAVTGLGLGHNPTAALLTRGLAEMTRLACACGARRETLAGLAGLGDLVLTCTGDLSRNRMVGIELGKGRKLPDIVGAMRMVAEGVKTTKAAVSLAQERGVEVPIIRQVDRVLDGEIAPREAIRELMERPSKQEFSLEG